MPFVWCKYISGKLMLVRWPNEKVCQPVYGRKSTHLVVLLACVPACYRAASTRLASRRRAASRWATRRPPYVSSSSCSCCTGTPCAARAAPTSSPPWPSSGPRYATPPTPPHTWAARDVVALVCGAVVVQDPSASAATTVSRDSSTSSLPTLTRGDSGSSGVGLSGVSRQESGGRISSGGIFSPSGQSDHSGQQQGTTNGGARVRGGQLREVVSGQ